MSVNIKEVAMQRLVSHHGWEEISVLDGPVVRKEFPTAVGLKEAVARITEGNAQHWLSGEYQSEGRNALSTCLVCIRTSASVTDVEAALDAFAHDVNKTVAQTYAARLLAV
jgi:hypothetical protein